jgi:hypothetical protein
VGVKTPNTPFGSAGVRVLRMGRRLHEDRQRQREANPGGQGLDADSDGATTPGPSIEVDHLTSDPVLKNLEERMKEWLSSKDAMVGGLRYQPRCAKLHRAQTEVGH